MPAEPHPFDFSKIISRLSEAADKPEAWWNHEVGDRLIWDGDRYQAAFTGLFLKAARNKEKLFEFAADRLRFKDESTALDEKINSFIQKIRDVKIPALYEQTHVEGVSSSWTSSEFIFSSESTIIQVLFAKDDDVEVNVSSLDKKIVDCVKKIVIEHLAKPSVQDLFVVVPSEDGLELVSIGKPGAPLLRDNYAPETLQAYDYVIKQFSLNEPFGRLVIAHGPAGTGKTHMIKAFIKEINSPNGKYIFLPAEFLLRHGAAAITKVLLDATKKGSSITLIIEDADDCLVPRQSDNMTAISTLLNVADGFIGNMLNIRIIATTNASTLDIDSAIKRPGRLCKLIKVDLLSSAQANSLFNKLTNKNGEFTKSMSLADVYAKVYKELGTAEDSSSNTGGGVGFSK
jgi:hypothetical protein